MPPARPTMKDVARQAGVSLNVVSRVCRPGPKVYVSDDARRRVLAAMAELGYHPDSRASALRSRRTHSLGFYTGYGMVTIELDFARALFDGLQSACAEHEQDLLLFHAMDASDPAETVRQLVSSKVDGILYHPRQGDEALSQALLDARKPVVRIGEPFPGMPSVVAEDAGGAARLARHLSLQGHRRVVFRHAPPGLVSLQRRRDGFCAAASALGMTVLSVQTGSPQEELSAEEERLLGDFRAEGITAVACWRDWSAARVLAFCRDRNIDVPEDLAVVGFDGLTPGFCPPDRRITTIVIDWQQIAETAVARLLDVIEGRPVPEEVVLPCSLYQGNTA